MGEIRIKPSIFFKKTFACPICQNKFREFRIKKSRQRVIRVDTDFATHCDGPNPIHYAVSVCPVCGYSFTKNFTSPSSETVRHLKSVLLPAEKDFSAERTHELAVYSFQRAIICSFINQEKEVIKGGLFLQLAWTHRFAGEEDDEKINLGNALYYYTEAFETDRNLTHQLPQMMYLIGELHMRLDNDREAIRWFGQLISNYKDQSPQYAKMARERWQEIRGIAMNSK
ncbi:MAG: DUF2225 domain-containing protein [Dethiobacteria bacterium]